MGRPRNSDDRAKDLADRKMATTVLRLVFWGFSCDAACECVGRLARDVLRRTDHEGFALGPDRIEQIYKDMLKSFSPPPRRQGITRRWLQGVRVWRLRRPDGSFFETPTLDLLAEGLLRGYTAPKQMALVDTVYGPEFGLISDNLINGDPEMTRGALAETEPFAEAKSAPVMPGPKTG